MGQPKGRGALREMFGRGVRFEDLDAEQRKAYFSELGRRRRDRGDAKVTAGLETKEYLRQWRAKRVAEGRALEGRKYWVRSKYGITLDDYDRMLKSQGGRCSICRTNKPGNAGGFFGKHFSIDHDHKTGRVRGLLCHNCNVMLAHAKDRPVVLQRAAAYLKRHSKSGCEHPKGPLFEAAA